MAKEFVGQEYVAATNGKGLHQESKATRFFSRLTIGGTVLITVASIAMIVCCVIFTMCPIIGTSMMTTLNASGKNTDSAITCIIGEPEHSEIVVFKLYMQNTKDYQYVRDAANGDPISILTLEGLKKDYYTQSDDKGDYMLIIKRVIGKPGDQISMSYTDGNYYLYLNGIRLDETYLDPTVAKHNAKNFTQLWKVLNQQATAHDMLDWVTVPTTECLTVNPLYSSNEHSRFVLTIPADHYFLMGDNRGSADEYNYSWDSTYFGPIPAANYVSRCVDVINEEISLPVYLWNKFVYYVCFGWAWQK